MIGYLAHHNREVGGATAPQAQSSVAPLGTTHPRREQEGQAVPPLHLRLAAAGLLHGRAEFHGRILLLHFHVNLLYEGSPLAGLLVHLAGLATSAGLGLILARTLASSSILTGGHLGST